MDFRGWESVLATLRERIGAPAYEAWFKGLRADLKGDVLVVHCPDRFSRDRIRSRFGRILQETAAGVQAIEYRVEPEPAGGGAASDAAGREGAAAPRPRAGPARAAGPEAWEPSFDSFVAGPSNALALEAARAVVRGHAGGCIPLVLSGASGLGKTHLCRAIQRALRSAGRGGLVYRSSEEFTSEVTQAMRSSQMPHVRQRYRREANVLILEDLQFLEGKRATQEELFHTLDHLTERDRLVVVTSSSPPHELGGLDPGLRSRLGSGLVAVIAPPELATRRQILRERAARGGVRVPDDCLEILAARSVESVRDLLAGLNQVVARASMLRQPVTPELVAQALSAVSVPGPARSVHEILDLVSRAYGTPLEELRGRSRRRRIVRPRQIAMYLCRRYTDASLKEIGRALSRDHSSVLHAVDVVERRTVEQPQLRYELETVAAPLRGHAASAATLRSGGGSSRGTPRT
jgi:chromosomal replication initiator protein